MTQKKYTPPTYGKKSPYIGLERRFQKSAIRYLSLRGILCFHTHNEGKRDEIKGAIMKREGMMAGVSDIIGIIRGQMFCLELKAGKGVLSPEQREFLEIAQQRGAVVGVAYSLDGVEEFINANFGALQNHSETVYF